MDIYSVSQWLLHKATYAVRIAPYCLDFSIKITKLGFAFCAEVFGEFMNLSRFLGLLFVAFSYHSYLLLGV